MKNSNKLMLLLVLLLIVLFSAFSISVYGVFEDDETKSAIIFIASCVTVIGLGIIALDIVIQEIEDN